MTDYPPHPIWKAKREREHRCACDTCWAAFVAGRPEPRDSAARALRKFLGARTA